MKKLVLLALVAVLTASAATISVASGGITLNGTDTTTAGSDVDPWLIDETMTSAGTLEFCCGPLGDDNPTGSGHAVGKWIAKTVLNDSGVDWSSFELELQVIL